MRPKPDRKKLRRELVEASRSVLFKAATHSAESGADLPRITIVMPSFNQSKFLERAMCSVLNQNYPNLEFIIMDGGSSDGSAEIIQKYESYLEHWQSGPDHGQAHAINDGLKCATGEWVGFQNSDDLYFPGAFDAFVETLRKNPDADVITGDICCIDEEDRVLAVVLTIKPRLWIQLEGGIQFYNQATFWRRSLLEKLGYFNTDYSFAFDYEFFTRLLTNGVRVVHTDNYMGAFRYHPQTKSMSIHDVGRAERDRAARCYRGPLLSAIPRPIAAFAAKLAKAAVHLFRGDIWYLTRPSFRPDR